MSQTTVAQLDEKVEECRAKVFKEISDIYLKLQAQDEVRQKMHDKLDRISAQSLANYEEFKTHDDKEMEKYDNIIQAIQDLTEATKANTSFIQSEQYNKAVDEKLAEKLAEREAPSKEAWRKVRMTIIVLGTGAMFSFVVGALKFGFDMWIILHGGVQ